MASDSKTRLTKSREARQQHIDEGVCSALNWSEMCVECRRAVKKVQVNGCVCDPVTGKQCLNHFDLDTYLLAASIRKGE